jgi:uncharacterized RDD family membrane protein YckC
MICSNHVEVSEGVRPCARCLRAYCADCLVTIQGQPFCATCKTEKLLDIQSGSDAAVLRFATLSRRLAAQWIDGILFGIPIVFAVGVFLYFGLDHGKEPSPFLMIGMVFFAAAFFLGFIAYEALMLGYRGQTLGKMLLHIKVVRPDGLPISKGQAWGRALVRGVMVQMLAFANYLPAFFTNERTCVHDMAAKTRVVSAD